MTHMAVRKSDNNTLMDNVNDNGESGEASRAW